MPCVPSLLETQRAMRRAIAFGEDAPLGPLVAGDGISAAERISIYRNTATGTSIRALRLSHPAVHRLVGADFFDAAARQYLGNSWPACALLDDFGEDFGSFLAAHRAAATLPYLGDVARLEWRVHRALHAADAPALDLARLSAALATPGVDIRFIPHPSVAVLPVSYPADLIWRAVIEEDDESLRSLDPAEIAICLLVQRFDTAGVQVQRLSVSHGRFVAALCAGTGLQDALDDAQGAAPEDDAQSGFDELLGQLLAAGRFTDFEPISSPRSRAGGSLQDIK